jgi:hypothetical protein
VAEDVWWWRMNEPILVQPTGPEGHMPPWLVDSLIEDLRAEGLDARLTYEPHGGGGAVWEIVVLWVAASAGGAVINKVVDYAFKWIEDQFRKYPDVHPGFPRPRAAEIRLYQGDEGKLYMLIEQEAADKEPVVRRSVEDFEDKFGEFVRWTRRKPPEGVYPRVYRGDRVRVRALPSSEDSRRYAGHVGRVLHYPPEDGAYTILMDDGTEILLRRDAFTPAESVDPEASGA